MINLLARTQCSSWTCERYFPLISIIKKMWTKINVNSNHTNMALLRFREIFPASCSHLSISRRRSSRIFLWGQKKWKCPTAADAHYCVCERKKWSKKDLAHLYLTFHPIFFSSSPSLVSILAQGHCVLVLIVSLRSLLYILFHIYSFGWCSTSPTLIYSS